MSERFKNYRRGENIILSGNKSDEIAKLRLELYLARKVVEAARNQDEDQLKNGGAYNMMLAQRVHMALVDYDEGEK